MSRHRRVRRATVIALVLAACTNSNALGDDPPGVEVVRSSEEFAASAPSSDVHDVVLADTAFAVDLLRNAWSKENLILSPFSISTALGMLEPGARGETRTEIALTLHETLGEDQLHPARGALMAALTAEPAPPEDGGTPFTLRAVNEVWAQQDYPILPAYLDVLARNYNAGVALLDFDSDPEAARQTINEAVAEQTEQRIEDLIPEGVVDTFTRLVLTNAVYFKANWLNEFDPDLTADGIFLAASGTEVTVPMMETSALLGYLDGDSYQAAWLPYVGDTSMMLLLPDGDIDDFLSGLTVEEIAAARDNRSSFQLDLTMPRFEFRSQLSLSVILKLLGMQAAFVPPPGPGSADLTGIVENGELYVQDVVHQGFIAVDEEGTEAAAATAVISGATALPQPAALVLDRPFVFFIHHESTGEIVFAGAVADPSR